MSRLSGEADDRWSVVAGAPGADRIRISPRQMALSASGSQKGAHVQNPETGRPVEGRTAWAVLPRPAAGQADPGEDWADVTRSPAAVVEALSTAFMILPLPKIEALCRRRPGLQAWVAGEAEGRGPGLIAVHLGGAERE